MVKRTTVIPLLLIIVVLCGCNHSLTEKQISDVKTVLENDLRPLEAEYSFKPTVQIYPSSKNPDVLILIDASEIADRPVSTRAKIAYELDKLSGFIKAQSGLPDTSDVFIESYINDNTMLITENGDNRITYKEGDLTLIYEQTWDEIEHNKEWN